MVGATREGAELLGHIGRWAAEVAAEPLSDEVAHDAIRATVDWFSATLPGARMEPARRLEAGLARDGLSQGEALLLTSHRRSGARVAALVNGTASHTAELDDIFRDGIYHPGSPTVAAALALAQQLGRSGEELLAAVTIGFEVSTRIAAAIQPAHYRYWHTTGTIGTLGAAAAGAALLRCDGEQTAHAIATSTTMAAGLQQAFRSDAMSKPLHAGHAADAGLLAALPASEGFTGALDILDGEAGLSHAMSDGPSFAEVFADLGERWNIGRMTIKNHASCGHTFAAVDGAVELRETHDLDPADIASIDVGTYGVVLKVAGHPDPQTAFEGRFSLPFCVASAFVRGSVRLDAFDDEALVHPETRRLVSSTTASVDPDFDASFPGQRAARVTVRTTDGRTLETTRLTRKGDPDDPLTDDELKDKYDELAVPILGADGAATLGDRLWGLRQVDDVRDLIPATSTEQS